MLASPTATHLGRDRQASKSGQEMNALKHQLDCYKTAAKQLGVLLVQRNREIEVLLQEMQLGTASRDDSTQGGPLIAAVWRKSATKAALTSGLDVDPIQESAIDQVAPKLPASKRKGFGNSRSFPSQCTAEFAGHARPQGGGLVSPNGWCLAGIPGGILAAASSPGDAKRARTPSMGSEEARESPHADGMAKDDFDGVHFGEAFWAVPEWDVPASDSASAERAIAWLQTVGLDAVVSDTSSQPQQHTHNGGYKHDDEPMIKTHSTDYQLDVAHSQVRALRDLVMSMQAQLGEARDKHSATREQLSHMSARLQHLQRAQQAWMVEQALQAAEMEGMLQHVELQGSDAAQLQVSEAALHQALRHEVQLMAQIINLQPATLVSETDSDEQWLSQTARGDRNTKDMHDAAAVSSAAEHIGLATADESRQSCASVTVRAANNSQAAAKPQQLRQAHSVIAELSARLAELECCNALLQDQLAISANDLIKSGPQDSWHADSFPWDVRAPAEMVKKVSQDSMALKAVVDSTQDAGSVAQAEDLANSSLAPSSTAGRPALFGSTETEDDAVMSINAAGHMTGTQASTPLAHGVTDGALQIVQPQAPRNDAEGGRPENFLGGEDQRAVAGLHSSATPQPGHQGPSETSREQASSAPLPAAPRQTASSSWGAMPDGTHVLTNLEGVDATQISSRLSAAEQQNARLAATHAELERCLLHAQDQLGDFAGAASAEVPAPAVHSFHAQEALTQAVAEVRSTAGQNTPELLPGRASARPFKLSTISQGAPGCVGSSQASCGAADLGPEQAAGSARLARILEQLAESERCRDRLEQQLLDVGEARLNVHMQELQGSTGLRAEVAEGAAKLARLAQQLAESERCRDSLQQQLLDLGEARLTAGSSVDGPARHPDTQHTPHDIPEAGLALSGSADSPGERDVARVGSPCGGFQSAAEREPGSALEAASSEVAALRVAMTQSEGIFLDLEAQLRAAFERESAAQHRIAALEQELGEASIHAEPTPVVRTTIVHDDSPGVPFVHHQSPASEVLLTQALSQEAQAIVADGIGEMQRAGMPAEAASQQMQLLTAQLRAALHKASEAETVIQRLHDQLFDQHAQITELRLALSISGHPNDTPDAALTSGAADVRAGASSNVLQIDYPVSNSLLKVAIVEEFPSDNASQLGTAELVELDETVCKAVRAGLFSTASAASISDLQITPKPPMPSLTSTTSTSQLAVVCALIAGQTESPEELYAILPREKSAPVSYSPDCHTSKMPAQDDTLAHRQGDAVHGHTATAHSPAERMRENPLFLQESAPSSDGESQGSGADNEAHHRTVRGREAQRIVQRLRDSYLKRRMSAPDAAPKPGMTGKDGAGRKPPAGSAPGRRRSSHRAQQALRPWSLPSLKRALAEQRRGSSDCNLSVSSSRNGSMLMGVEDEEDLEVLDTIYANLGDIDQMTDTGERDDSHELNASLVERCTLLEKALQEATQQLADSQAAEARLQSQNSILRAESCALTARLAELREQQQRHRPAQREQAAYKPASRATAAPPPAHLLGIGALLGPNSAESSQRALTAQAHAGGGKPCSQYAWELQDLHLRMAAAIAQIRQLEADKAKVARQLGQHALLQKTVCGLPHTE